MRITLFAAAAACSVLVGCAKDELRLTSKIDYASSLEVRAPKATLRGGCDAPFRDRFCAEEYEVIGVIDVSAREDRLLTISDPVNDEQCTNILWLRLVRLGEIGPVEDPGTLLLLPSDAEIEQGAGSLHSVAFPQATVRIDEIGTEDANQSQPPLTCAEANRTAR